MKVGDWVMACVNSPGKKPNVWRPAVILEVDDCDDDVPWKIRFAGKTRDRWRGVNRVRQPESDDEWAAIAAHRLIEGI
jgi:hypothetical protein